MSFKISATSHADRFEVTGIPGPSLLEQLQAASVPIKSSCQGKGICRQCRVKVTRGIAPVTPSDRKAFKEGQLADGWRLSCGIRPKLAIEVSFPRMYVFQNEIQWLRDPVSEFAWACDFGTTGVEISAVDTHGEFARVKGLNRQVVRGADIMTRLEYAQTNGVEALRQIAEEQIEKMVGLLRKAVAAKSPAAKERPEMTIAGNSAVISFLANMPIETLAVSPYQPATLAPQMLKLGGINTKTLPLLNSFVGGDLFAGVFHLWTTREEFEEPWILMDVGTNSEILFFDGEKLVVASTPAGPAFEGSNISIGMRAEPGAIIDPRFVKEGDPSLGLGKWSFRVIGDDVPKGICGSALVQAIDEAVTAGISNSDGEILKPELLPFDSETSLNQDDFREFQLAKSAIRTGLDLVQKASRTPPKRLFLAGAFGEHLPLAASRRLGLLPDLETIALGNASLKGTVDWMHASAEEREEFIHWIEAAKHPIELALSDDFQSRFIENLTLRPGK